MYYKAQNFPSQPEAAKSITISACIELCSSLQLSIKSLLNLFILFSNRFERVYFTQSYVAEKLGIRRETANRLIAKLCKLGILVKEYRHMTSCNYYLDKVFNNLDLRSALKPFYWACKYLPITLLMSLGDEMKSLNSMIGVNQWNQRKYVERYDREDEKPGLERMSHEIYSKDKYISTDNNSNSKFLSYPTTPGHTKSNSSDEEQASKVEIVKKHFEVSRTDEENLPKSRSRSLNRPNHHIKGLNLTEAGCIKLMAYPPSAIQAACEALRSHKGSVLQPFTFFSRLCFNYCKANHLQPDWGLCFNELRSKGYDKDAVGVDLENPYLYYTQEEADALYPQKPKTSSAFYPKPNQQEPPLYKKAIPPPRRLFDRFEESEKAKKNLELMAKTGIPGLDDIFADILRSNILEGPSMDLIATAEHDNIFTSELPQQREITQIIDAQSHCPTDIAR